MKDLRLHWDEFETRVAVAGRACVMSDFDGTLVPLAERPELAQLPVPVRRLLEGLLDLQPVTLGIVSGRSLEDLRARVALARTWYVGNHGFEIQAPGGEVTRFYEPGDVAYLDSVRDALREKTADIPGVILEHKGPIVALHYRKVDPARVPDVERAFLAVAGRQQRQVMIARGHKVLEARLRGSCNKGRAVGIIRKEMPRETLFLYFGDDLTDRDVFRELKHSGLTVEVGGDETSLADYFVPGPGDVLDALQRVADILGHGTRRERAAARSETRRRRRR